MAILKSIKPQHLIYEHAELNILVAIPTKDTQKIKSFWKSNKGKSNIPTDTIQGYRFVHDDEQESLKIDFSTLEDFEIRSLQKYA